MKAFWDERYSHSEYAYGEQPNEFLKAQLENFPVGAILFPAEGEGRNSVFAARSGWQASAFDQSAEGQKKAIQLAEKNGVTIDYIVNSFQDLPYLPGQFDAVGLFYAHFPAENRQAFHRQLADFLRPGGVIILEGFSKKNLEYLARNSAVGGPREIQMLFSTDEIRADFAGFEILQLAEEEVELNEGLYHKGTGSVVRFVGRK